jgi:uncharacterized protein (DUF2345 family)
MAVIWRDRTGHYRQILSQLARSLGQYARHHQAIKVGLTTNSDMRWVQHKADGWTSSSDSSSSIELPPPGIALRWNRTSSSMDGEAFR